MKKKSKSSLLFVIIVAAICIFAFAGFKGFVLCGYEFKSFDKVITKGLDLQGGVSVLMEIQGDKVTKEQLENTKQHLELRVNSLGVAETVVNTEGDRRIRVDIPGYSDSNGLVQNLSKSGNLVFKDPNGEEVITGKDVKNQDLWLKIIGIKDKYQNLKFNWVKGHDNDKYNIECDAMCQAKIREGVAEVQNA